MTINCQFKGSANNKKLPTQQFRCFIREFYMKSKNHLPKYNNQLPSVLPGHENLEVKVSVNLSPTEIELASLSWLLNAVDLLVRFNCFSNQNPMKISQDNHVLKPWQWAIVQIGTISFPAPINLHTQTDSFLFTYSDETVLLSNEECAVTTAVFYLNQLIHISFEWDEFSRICPPIHLGVIGAGLKELDFIGQYGLLDLLEILKDQLSTAGYRVLN